MTPLVRIPVFALCACAGFVGVRPLTPPARVASPTPHAAPLPTARVGLPPLTAAESAFIAEWEQIRARHGGTGADLPALYQQVKELKDPFRRRAFGAALIAEWATTDPLAALAFLKDKDWADAHQVAREWIRRDPQAAISGLLAAGEGPRLGGLLTEIVTLAPARLAEVVAALPKPGSPTESYVQDAFALFAGKDPVAARAAAESLQGPRRGQALAGVARTWAEKDGPAALAWAQAMPTGEVRDDALKAVLTGWAATDPMAALAKIELAPPGGNRMMTMDVGALVLREAATRDWDATLAWLREHPGKLGSNALDGMRDILSHRLESDPVGTLHSLAQSGLPNMRQLLTNAFGNDNAGQHEAIWQWLDQQPLNEFTRSAREALLTRMAWTDADTAIAYLDKLPNTEENRKFFENSMRSLLRGDRADRFEDFLANVSPKLRPYFLEAGFTYEVDKGDTDPSVWLSRLEELPADQQLNATGGLARGWAMNDPQAAVGWASSLGDPVQRDRAIGVAVSVWAGTDIYTSSQWINSLPAGGTRDSAVQGLVGALIKSTPESAWTWALSIETPGTRLSALQVAYAGLTQKDPGRAREFLQNAGLSATEVETVQRPPAPPTRF